MTDILLINASFRIKRDIIGEGAMIQPMGVSCLAAYLRKYNYDVQIYEPSVYGGTLDEHIERIKSSKFKVLGISQCAIQYKGEVYKLIKEIRESGFKGHITLGGHNPSLQYERILNECPELDSVCIGEGEITLLELMNCIGQGTNWRNIKGIAYKGDKGIIRTDARELITDLDTLPFPARDILECRKDVIGDKAVAYLLSSRGCYQECSFCSVAAYYKLQCGKKFRYRSVENIIDEMKSIYEKYKIIRFSFIDDNFILPGQKGVERAKKFYEYVSELPFSPIIDLNTRVDTVTEEAIFYLKKSGLISINIGIESFLDEDLKLYNKKISAEQIEDVLKTLYRLGYSTEVGSKYRVRTLMIVFNPFTTIEGLRKHVSIMRSYKVSPKKVATSLTVYDYTYIRDLLESENLLKERNEWIFKDYRVAPVFEYFIKYVKHAMLFREKIRIIEKYSERDRITIDKENFIKVRSNIDEACYNFLEMMLNLNSYDVPKKNLEIIYNNSILEFNSTFDSDKLKMQMENIESRLGISLNGCYLYEDI